MIGPNTLQSRIVKALELGPASVRTLATQLSAARRSTRECLRELESIDVVRRCGSEYTNHRHGGRAWVRYELVPARIAVKACA